MRFGRLSVLAAGLAGASVLAGCNTTGNLMPAPLVSVGSCPGVDIIAGAQAIVVHDPASSADPSRVRYQAAILDTARQCLAQGSTLTMTVGVSGRIVAGPRADGGTGSATVRIAVLLDTKTVLYQQAYQVSAGLAAPAYGGDFNIVAGNISVPVPAADQRLSIVAGFVPN
jgi:hypothetical protein